MFVATTRAAINAAFAGIDGQRNLHHRERRLATVGETKVMPTIRVDVRTHADRLQASEVRLDVPLEIAPDMSGEAADPE